LRCSLDFRSVIGYFDVNCTSASVAAGRAASAHRKVPCVMFFTDPVTGYRHGYYDGLDDDGLFNYVGEGQRGDQRLVQGNKAILDHLQDGRTLEGFRPPEPARPILVNSTWSTTTSPRRTKQLATSCGKWLSSASAREASCRSSCPMFQ
jgi:hypothetical protein